MGKYAEAIIWLVNLVLLIVVKQNNRAEVRCKMTCKINK